MGQEDFSDEYAQIVLESRRRGEVTELPPEEERREFPRLTISASDLWIDSVAQFTVVDMSPSGVALVCNHPIETGKVLNFTTEPDKDVEAEVVACELDESPTEHLDAQYRVHCKFRDKKMGMNLVVAASQAKD